MITKVLFAIFGLAIVIAGGLSYFTKERRLDTAQAQALVSPGIFLRNEVSLRYSADKTKIIVESPNGALPTLDVVPAMVNVWQQFLSEIAKGGQVFYFDSPPDRWASLSGSRGYLLVRDKQLVDAVVTLRN